MPDNSWETRQHVLIGQLNMLPVCNWSLFLGKDLSCDTALPHSPSASPLLQLCHLLHEDWKDLRKASYWELIGKGMPLKLTLGQTYACKQGWGV